MSIKTLWPLLLALVLRAMPAMADMASDRTVLNEAKAIIEDAYYTDNKAELEAQIERLKPLTKSAYYSWYAHYYISFCHNHISMLTLESNEEESSINMEAALENVEIALDAKESAELYVLLISIMGKKIELGPSILRLPRGLQTLEYMDKAKELAPNMPGVVFEDAHVTMHTPEKLGGGKAPAKRLLLKVVELLKDYESPDPFLLNWHQEADVFAWLAFVEMELGNMDEAKKYLDMAVQERPDHAFVNKILMHKYKSMKTSTKDSVGG